MKSEKISRKHGRKAGSEGETFAAGAYERSTSVVFERSNQVYLWTTDRGRIHPIKH